MFWIVLSPDKLTKPSSDYDPEGEFRQEDDDDESGSQQSEDDIAATEHYVSVG